MTGTATASRPLARVSLKDSVKILENLRNKSVKKAKAFLNDLIGQKRDIDGKYYTGASRVILELIEEAENNADSLGLGREKLFIKEATANQAFRFMLSKSRWSHRGRKAKLCQLKVTLEER
ncbi:MAG: uL22 family ribosomal protein [Candidatus Aenigmarchaeota archaeon]|nr:uL22 family ribosomal protein [Candidatus Aenigmarchaeota archaeon]